MSCEPSLGTIMRTEKDRRTEPVKDLSEAKETCSGDSNCYMFYDFNGTGNAFEYCSDAAELKSSSHGSILYKPGNCLSLPIFV